MQRAVPLQSRAIERRYRPIAAGLEAERERRYVTGEITTIAATRATTCPAVPNGAGHKSVDSKRIVMHNA